MLARHLTMNRMYNNPVDDFYMSIEREEEICE